MSRETSFVEPGRCSIYMYTPGNTNIEPPATGRNPKFDLFVTWCDKVWYKYKVFMCTWDRNRYLRFHAPYFTPWSSRPTGTLVSACNMFSPAWQNTRVLTPPHLPISSADLGAHRSSGIHLPSGVHPLEVQAIHV